MSKFVVSIGSRLRSMPVVVLVVWLAWAGILAVSSKLNIADYLSSVAGYDRLPYNDVDPNLGLWVGLLPQLIQVAFGVWAVEKGHRLAAIVTLVAFLVDIYTDVVFKTAGLTLNPMEYGFAITLTFFMFSVGSEFLLVASLQNLREYGPDAWKAFVEIFGGIWKRVLKLFGKGVEDTVDAAKSGAAWVLGDAAPPGMTKPHHQPQTQSLNQARRQQGFEPLGGVAESEDDDLERAIALAQTYQTQGQGHRKGMGRDKLRERFGNGNGNSTNGA